MTALIAIALIQQSFESMLVPAWDAALIKSELPKPLRPIIDGYRAAVILRLLAATILFVFPHWSVFLVLAFTTWIINLRWRGTFNGGADTMTMQILLVGLFTHFFADQPYLVNAGMYYLAIQAALSYFVAGVVKIKNPEWRNGLALPKFLEHSGYRSAFPRALSWGIILFECTFPLALFSQTLALLFCGAGACFHLVNAYVLGLNRFFWVWIATYPAIWFTATTL